MADLKHFEAGRPGFVEDLNAVVDQLNEALREIDDLKKEVATKADKRKSAASK